jgi:hypothetical protein
LTDFKFKIRLETQGNHQNQWQISHPVLNLKSTKQCLVIFAWTILNFKLDEKPTLYHQQRDKRKYYKQF